MDWDDLRYFLAVRRAGTLGAAARALGVEHTTVSRRLAALERSLGAKLFVRTPDGFVLTPAGAQLGPQAEAMENAAAAVQRSVAGDDERAQGLVRLTTSEAFSGYLVKRLGPIRERYPELLIEIIASNKPLDLARGEADLALRMVAPTEPDLVARRVVDTGWSLYAATSYVDARGRPSSYDNLTGHDVILFEASLARSPGAQWLDEGRGGRPALRANSVTAALNAAIAGFGVAAAPCLLGDAEPTLTRLTPELIATCTAYLVMHRDLARLTRVRTVADFVVDLLKADTRALIGK